MLECPDDILAFEFSPSDPNIIAGGCVNGQVLSSVTCCFVANCSFQVEFDQKYIFSSVNDLCICVLTACLVGHLCSSTTFTVERQKSLHQQICKCLYLIFGVLVILCALYCFLNKLSSSVGLV